MCAALTTYLVYSDGDGQDYKNAAYEPSCKKTAMGQISWKQHACTARLWSVFVDYLGSVG
jgi:hypothetical protein